METCESCAFWGDAKDAQNKETFRQCNAMFHDVGSNCGGDGRRPEPDPIRFPELNAEWHEARSHKAVVQDGSGYFAALKCRSDFGCVLHNPRSEDGDIGPTT